MMISFTAVKSLIQVVLLGHSAAAIVLCMLFSILTRGSCMLYKIIKDTLSYKKFGLLLFIILS